MCQAVSRYGRIWQTGSWQRSEAQFRKACELVRNGRIGKVHRVDVYLPIGPETSVRQPKPAPGNLDWDFWLGPAPWAPYTDGIHPFNWRWILAYGGGQLMDWIGHHADIAHWGLGLDYTGPVEIEARGNYPQDGLYDAPPGYEAHARYANGVEMLIASRSTLGTKWYGERGWIFVNRSGLEASDPALLEEKIGPDEIHLYESNDHVQNFLDCVRSRRETIAPAEIAHRSASVGHLAMVAMTLGRKLKWDPVTEHFVEDAEAQSLLSRSYRSPWYL
jgi:predicted dehydrogenase